METTYASLRQLDHHEPSPIRVYLNRESDDYPAHWHRQYEIILPVHECYTVMVENANHQLLPGDALVIPSGVVHEIFAPAQGTRYIILVDQEVVYGIGGMTDAQHVFYPCIHLRADQDILIQNRDDLWHAVQEHERGERMSDAAVVAWVTLFLIRLSRWLLQQKETGSRDHRHRMSETFLDVCAYISAHCSEKLTLEDMAAHSGYSKYHFTRVFKEYSGMSFYEYYMRQRMMLCRQLLAEQDLSVTDVALRSGFGSIATFNRIFKQYEGITPTQYRQMKQNVHGRAEDR